MTLYGIRGLVSSGRPVYGDLLYMHFVLVNFLHNFSFSSFSDSMALGDFLKSFDEFVWNNVFMYCFSYRNRGVNHIEFCR